MVEVICDTSFLLHLATKRIKNIDNLGIEIGSIQFVVPDIVIYELNKLCKDVNKKKLVVHTFSVIKNLKKIKLPGTFVDDAISLNVKLHGGIIATLDTKLKNRIKKLGGSVMSLTNNKIILEQ